MKENANSENGTSFTHEKFFETSWVEMRCVAAAETHESRVCKLAIFCADSFLIPIVNGNFSLFPSLQLNFVCMNVTRIKNTLSILQMTK